MFGHFVLPFCLLLSQDLKKRPKLLARVAWFIVAIRLYDLIWLVAPDLQPGRVPDQPGQRRHSARRSAGVWVFLFAGQLRKTPLLPVNDPYFKHMLAHGHQGGH